MNKAEEIRRHASRELLAAIEYQGETPSAALISEAERFALVFTRSGRRVRGWSVCPYEIVSDLRVRLRHARDARGIFRPAEWRWAVKKPNRAAFLSLLRSAFACCDDETAEIEIGEESWRVSIRAYGPWLERLISFFEAPPRSRDRGDEEV